MRKIIVLLCCLFAVLPIVAQEELCMDGTLLFREDFGGNSPSDPEVSMANVPGMSSQYHNSGNSLGSGNYSLRKEGWHNGIQWHWQDDHTYPDDKTRGYLLEIDGVGGSQPFYSKTIDGLVANTKLTFSAYVVNVHYAGQLDYFGSSYVYPRLKFVLKDPTTGSTLAEKSTGDIQPDWRYGTPETWKYARDNQLSAEWQLVGMNFIVPDGVTAIQMFIYNDVAQNGSGNDFAIDDIEIHLCLPVPTIVSDSVACKDSTYQFAIDFENDGRLTEPLEYRWYFGTDAMVYGDVDVIWWEEIPDSNTPSLLIDPVSASATGWYKIAIAGNGNIDVPMNRTESEPFHLRIKRCPPPPLECPDGVLLFREDFGGNDPDDPTVSSTPVPGMSSGYRQIKNLEPKGNNNDMGSGRYLVAKQGYRNSTISNYSVWHVMDDHTYPDDKTRGYLLEIDGTGGNDAFYKTTMEGLCPGTRLTFSAWIANLTTAGQYHVWKDETWRGYVHPELKFVIKNPQTGAIIAQQATDTISHDWSNYPKSWSESAEWQQIGMNFTVPQGVESVELYIYNYASGSTGNDFALDDIELRLCGVPEVHVSAPDTVCVDTKNTFIVTLGDGSTPPESLQYQWYFSPDSLTWTPLNDGQSYMLKLKARPQHTGWYQVAVAAKGQIDSENCRSMSEPFKLYVIDDCPPILCPEGVLLYHEDFNGSATFCDTTLRHLCSGLGMSFIVNLPSAHADTRLMLRLYDAATDQELVAYDTGDIPSDSVQVGTSFYIPEGVSGLRWTIRNNKAGSTGLPFPLDNLETRICMEPIHVQSANPACRKKSHTLYGIYENWGTLERPVFRWEYSPDSINWTELQQGTNKNYTIPVVHRSHEGWYKVTVADDGNLDRVNCREISDPFKLETMYCNTAVDQYIDTTACDTLLEYDLHWRGHAWPKADTTQIDTIQDFEDDDSLYVHFTLHTRICCPDIERIRIDSAVCDTLMPFMWFFRDTMLLFDEPAEKEIEYRHPRWENCIGTIYTLALDTFHCERLYLLIHNKYNWQLVCNNVELTRLFPELTPLQFQWFKDSVEIEGANSDDYSEEHELYGCYQLRIKLSEPVDNDDEFIWSNILDIHDTPAPAPVTKRIYNSNGMLVGEDRMTQGVYLILYQQGDKFWTEKKYIK